jgi:processive 1,2-diacylglycerol beta-glucosyltransferase
MQTNPKVLILLAGYGDGHLQVSKALQESFAAQGVTNVMLVDLFSEAYPALDALSKFVYVKSYSIFPSLYGWIYDRTKHMQDDTVLTSWFHSWGIGKLRKLIAAEQPDVVINTFPMPAMPELCKRTGISVPIYNVLTDFTLHSRWIHPKVDKFYVATEDLKAELSETGIQENRIFVSGIPLKQAFQSTTVLTKRDIYAKYDLQPDKKTVLIMAGSYGVLQGLKALTRKLASRTDAQMIVVCGKNAILYEKMVNEFGNHPSFRLFGFVETVHELMTVADCIVTKPGGITLSEALHCELPILLYRPVPGQELENALYLERKGAARIAHNPEQLAAQIVEVLHDDDMRERTQEVIRALKRTDASDRIVADILSKKLGLKDQTGALFHGGGLIRRRFELPQFKRKPGKAR